MAIKETTGKATRAVTRWRVLLAVIASVTRWRVLLAVASVTRWRVLLAVASVTRWRVLLAVTRWVLLAVVWEVGCCEGSEYTADTSTVVVGIIFSCSNTAVLDGVVACDVGEGSGPGVAECITAFADDVMAE